MNKKIKYLIYTTLITAVVTGCIGLVLHIVENRVDERMESKKELSEQSKENTEDEQEYMFIANINDPDGYTNVRSAPTKQSEVLDKILEGEDFKVLGLLNSWYKVESPTGKIGFVYFNRVVKKQ